jgi:tetratricopeptide (TPR) repeat protein
MIVKNEAAVIRRCLDAVIPFIDRWSICDTGSTDGTQGIIRDALAGIPGRLHEDPWVDFGHNRSLAVTRARGMAEYHLLINADQTLSASGDFRHLLVHDQYVVRVDGALECQVATVVSDRLRWRFVGATHEYIGTDGSYTRAQLPGVVLTDHADGGSRGDRLERDLRVLIKAVEERPDDPHSLFYLAQTLRDMGRRDEAVEWYAKRADAGGWDEEVYQSLYQIARLRHLSEAPWETVVASYLTAYEYRPARLEPLLHVARHYRERQQYRLGHQYSRPVVHTPYPAGDLLFVERGVYQYELPLEYGICCYWLGEHQEAIRVNRAILATPGVPAAFVEAARRNLQFSLDALAR